jgi:hypothetical protein
MVVHAPRRLFGTRSRTSWLQTSPDLTSIILSKLHDKHAYLCTTSLSLPSITLIDVVEGLYGVSESEQKKCQITSVSHCFSLLFSNATWYLEASSQQQKMMFIHAYSWLKNYASADIKQANSSSTTSLSASSSSTPSSNSNSRETLFKLYEEIDRAERKNRSTLYKILLRTGQWFQKYSKRRSPLLFSLSSFCFSFFLSFLFFSLSLLLSFHSILFYSILFYFSFLPAFLSASFCYL